MVSTECVFFHTSVKLKNLSQTTVKSGTVDIIPKIPALGEAGEGQTGFSVLFFATSCESIIISRKKFFLKETN